MQKATNLLNPYTLTNRQSMRHFGSPQYLNTPIPQHQDVTPTNSPPISSAYKEES